MSGGFSAPRLSLIHEGMSARVESDESGKLKVSPMGLDAVNSAGSTGLLSTANDYLAFARMLLGNGRLGKTRILSRPSVELMTMDHLTPAQKALSPFAPGFWDLNGWGFGVSVVTRRNGLGPMPGSYGWDGGFGTSWRNDPPEAMTSIFLSQRMMQSPDDLAIATDFLTLAYQAIDD